jgi:hypothetical protein
LNPKQDFVKPTGKMIGVKADSSMPEGMAMMIDNAVRSSREGGMSKAIQSAEQTANAIS